jgi:prepilin-type N-terminal cleavage/methylation domain-containing protein/prepilin-type processing-associated H-X9-DG protein
VPTREGFTLIELLVVMSVIALLAALLIPASLDALRRARVATCLSQMRQIGTSLLLIAQEGAPVVGPGYFPGESGWDMVDGQVWNYTWFGLVANDLGLADLDPPKAAVDLRETRPKLFLCPEADRATAGWDADTLSFGYNIAVGPTVFPGSRRPETVGSIEWPSRMGVLADSDGDGIRDAWVRNRYLFPPGSRHRQGANVFFGDGHARWLPYRELMGHGRPFE